VEVDVICHELILDIHFTLMLSSELSCKIEHIAMNQTLATVV